MDTGSFIQVDVSTQLETVAVRELRDPDPERAYAWRPIVSESDRVPWVAADPLGVRPEPFASKDLPFVSQQHEEAMQALAAFQAQRPSDARLNGETGLPVFLFGNLQPDQDGSDHLLAAATFLAQNQLVVAGRNRFVGETLEGSAIGLQFGIVQRLYWPDRTDQIRFQQYSPKGGAIYGAQVVATFDAKDRLVLLTSSLYPAVEELPAWPEELPPLPDRWYEESYGFWALQLAELIPKKIGFKRLIRGSVIPWVYPQRRFADLPDDSAYLQELVRSWRYDDKRGRWRFHDKHWEEQTRTPIQGRYVPVVEAAFEDAYGSFWRAILDVSKAQEPRLIELILDEHELPQFYLFHTAEEARRYFSDVEGDPNLDPQSLADSDNLQGPLDFGAGTSFDDATGVTAPDYVYPAGFPLPEVFRAPTVFYHLWQAQYRFGQFFNNACIEAIAPPAALLNPLNSITVQFEEAHDGCVYNEGVIHIRRGTSSPPEIDEPGCDPEVVAHEFTHAVVDFYFNNLFSKSLHVNYMMTPAVNGLNEGQAFYLATSVFPGSQWSDYAYAHWRDERELSTESGFFDYDLSASDHAGIAHGLGIWLARLFWKIATTTQGRSMDFLLYKAFGALAGAVLSNVATGVGRNSRSRAVLSLFATTIWQQCDAADPLDPAPQRDGVRQIFTEVGLTVP